MKQEDFFLRENERNEEREVDATEAPRASAGE